MRIAILILIASLPFWGAKTAEAVPAPLRMQHAVMVDRDPRVVEAYLKAGFDPRSSIGCGTFDSLDGAVYVDSPEMVNVLLHYGARPKEATFVHAAFLPVLDNAVSIVAAFLRAGADVNSKMIVDSTIPDRYWMALDQAVWRQNTALVHLLLSQKGIVLNYVNGDGWTPLEIAYNKGNRVLVKMLIAAGADPHVGGNANRYRHR